MGRWLQHELSHGETVVKLGPEDDVTDAGNIYHAQKYASLVDHWQEVVVAAAYLSHEFAHRQIGMNGMIVFLDDTLHAHQREGRTVDVMSEQFALSCQSQGVDAVALEDADSEV